LAGRTYSAIWTATDSRGTAPYKKAAQLHTAAGKRLGVGPAAEPPRLTHTIAASRQLQVALSPRSAALRQLPCRSAAASVKPLAAERESRWADRRSSSRSDYPAKIAARVDTYIANFGHRNYLWPECLRRSTIATMESEDLRPFWLANDRHGYIAHAIATKKTSAGITPTPPVASRWFNLASIVTSTEHDLWIHREKNALWWTISRPGEVEVILEPAHNPAAAGDRVYVYHKPAELWSNANRLGNRLEWPALHAKAREFLFTESTLQKLSPAYAAYAAALINGDDLRHWHDQPEWRRKADAARRNPGIVLNARQRAVADMAATVRATVRNALGQQVLRTVKRKELRFANPEALERYIDALLASQDDSCAITGLPLQFPGSHDDPEMITSLDRIDSNGHYEEGNLQIVCRFVNRWKNDGDDTEFRRLIAVVRNAGKLAS
jgi:hypothetical protein